MHSAMHWQFLKIYLSFEHRDHFITNETKTTLSAKQNETKKTLLAFIRRNYFHQFSFL